jgi:hypothetical protein
MVLMMFEPKEIPRGAAQGTAGTPGAADISHDHICPNAARRIRAPIRPMPCMTAEERIDLGPDCEPKEGVENSWPRPKASRPLSGQ